MVRLSMIFLVLLPAVLWAAVSEKVTFTGYYNTDGVGTEVDSAWLVMAFNGDRADSLMVNTDGFVLNGDVVVGYYTHTLVVTDEDSLWGWSGTWIFLDDTRSVEGLTNAEVTYSSDSVSTRIGTENAIDNNFSFTSGDVKATLDGETVTVGDFNSGVIDDDALGTISEIQDEAEDAIDAKFTFTGSDVNVTLDGEKVTLVDSSADAIHDIRHEEVLNINGWNPSSANLARDATKDDYKATGFSTFDPDNDPVMVDEIKQNTLGDSTLQDGATEYMADCDTTGLMHEADLDSLIFIRWSNFAIWGLHQDEDSSYLAERKVSATADVDSEQIARSVWDNDIISQASRTVNTSGGAGEYQVKVLAYDTAASTVLMDAEITIRNESETSQRWTGNANDSGWATFMLDAGTYSVGGSGTREMAEVDTISVTDDMADTLLFWSTIVSAPGAANLCTVYGILMKPDGTRLANADVYFTLSSPVTDTSTNVSIGAFQIYETSNDTGYVEVPLIKNGNCVPRSSYDIKIEHSDITAVTYDISIPADSSYFDFVAGGNIH